MNLTPMQQKQIDHIMAKLDFELIKKCVELAGGGHYSVEKLKELALNSMHSAIEEGRNIFVPPSFWVRHWDHGLFYLQVVLIHVDGGSKVGGAGGPGITVGDDEAVIPV